MHKVNPELATPLEKWASYYLCEVHYQFWLVWAFLALKNVDSLSAYPRIVSTQQRVSWLELMRFISSSTTRERNHLKQTFYFSFLQVDEIQAIKDFQLNIRW